MELTQDEYTLWTSDTRTFSYADWTKIVAVASGRLASFLCLDSLPEPLPEDLKQLLAEFICATLKFQGGASGEVESKSVRNFTIRFRSDDAANAFAQIAKQFDDIIGKYSECGIGIDVESGGWRHNCCERTWIYNGRF